MLRWQERDRAETPSALTETERWVHFHPSDTGGCAITAIHETLDGRFWCATIGSGVLVFDGVVWRCLAPPCLYVGSVCDDVYALHEHTDGTLWLGTRRLGVVAYNRRRQRWKAFPPHPRRLRNGTVCAICERRDGTLWFGDGWFELGGNGVSVYDPHSRRWQHLSAQDGGLASDAVRVIYESRDRQLWFGTWGAGVSVFDGRHWRTLRPAESAAMSDEVSAIGETPDGIIWIATTGGLAGYDPRTNSWHRPAGAARRACVYAMHIARDGTIWLAGGTGTGIVQYDPRTDRSIHFTKETGALRNDLIWSIHERADGSLWFGTNNGISVCLPPTHYRLTPENSGLAGPVNDVLPRPGGEVWFATDNGLSIFNVWTGHWDERPNLSDAHSQPVGNGRRAVPLGRPNLFGRRASPSLSKARLVKLCEGANEVVWIYGHFLTPSSPFLCAYHIKTNRCELFDATPMTDVPLPFTMCADASGKLFVATAQYPPQSRGVLVFDPTVATGEKRRRGERAKGGRKVFSPLHPFTPSPPQSSGWQRWDSSNTDLPSDDVRAVAVTGDGTLWCGLLGPTGRGGVVVFDGNRWRRLAEDPYSPLAESVNWICPCADGAVWCGGPHGAMRVESLQPLRYTHYHAGNSGLVATNVWAIYEGQDGILFFVTLNGISAFDGENWFTVTEDQDFHQRPPAGIEAADGSLWVVARDRSVRRYLPPPRVQPQTFLINDRGVVFNTDASGEVRVYELWDEHRHREEGAEKIFVSRRVLTTPSARPHAPSPLQSLVTADYVRVTAFAVNPWRSDPPEDFCFSARLDDGKWTPFQKEPNFLFTGLTPGRHVIEVRAKNRWFRVDRTPARWEFYAHLPPVPRSPHIARTVQFISEHLDDPLTLDQLAEVAHTSRYHFVRAFKREMGCAPHQHLLRTRLDAAARQLTTTERPVKEIAFACGFSSPEWFTAAFRKAFGVPPTQFRRLKREQETLRK